MSSIVELVFALLVLAVLIWGGERLLALWPGNSVVKQVVRIIAIVAIALWCLSEAASFLGVALPWPGTSVHRRH